MRQYYRVMAPGDGDPERPDRPEYNVYRAGSGGRGRGSKGKQQPAKGAGASPDRSSAPEEGPGYHVYKARRGFKRPGGSDGPSLRDRLRRDRTPREPGEKPLWRRIGKWALIAAVAWFLLSVVLFAVSAQIQKGKLDDRAGDLLGGSPFLAATGGTILVIGTDARPEATGAEEAETRSKCIDQGATGSAPSSDCPGFRADTLMLVRAGGGAFEKVSIPRDTLADIPGQGPAKINGAYSAGGAALQIETVENFLGIDVDHVIILDFEGFADFIDSIGGVTVNLPDRVKSEVDGGGAAGGVTLKLDPGENDLNGQEALALARTRVNQANPAEDDTDRARRQQLILQGIKDRLTSPWRIPINFLRGPLIAWNAPKAMVTDMGGLLLPQLALASAIGGDSGTKILNPSGTSGDGALIVAESQCRRAVEELLGEPGPRPPECSPGG